MSSATVNQSVKNKFFRVLRQVSSAHGVLPKSYFPAGVTLSDVIPHSIKGGSADVWKGQQGGNQVCIKTYHTQTAADLKKVKRVCGSSLFQPGVGLTRFRSEVLPWDCSVEICFASECGTLPRSLGNVDLVFHHHSLATEWKHCQVHPETRGGR